MPAERISVNPSQGLPITSLVLGIVAGVMAWVLYAANTSLARDKDGVACE
jgi:hypothetical protein